MGNLKNLLSKCLASYMTVRITPENHLLIERYLDEVRKVMSDGPLTMGTAMP